MAAAAAHAKAAIEARYLMALQRPRDMALAQKRLLDSCQRVGFAEEAMYARPVGKKKVGAGREEHWEDTYTEGLSIRFAEEAARSWGNLMVESAVVEEDDDQRILRVIVTDLEVNLTYPFDVVVGKTVERRSLKKGQKAISSRANSYGDIVYRVEATDDDVYMKQNALASKAMRTGVLRLIPADVQEECKRRIQQTLATAAKESGATEKVVQAFETIGVAKDHLEGYLNHSVDKMTPREFAELRGIFQAIKDGETTWEAVARTVPDTSKKSNPAGIRSDGYETKDVKREVIDVASKPKMTGPLPPDPYKVGKDADQPDAADDEDRSLDQRLAEEAG